jgi:hypothetical protein
MKPAKRGVEATLDPVQQWVNTIATYEREFKKWETRTERILKRYRDEGRLQGRGENSQAKFNILWSNVQTAIPAVFSRLPKPDVSRRHRDNDPVGRVAALLLERALEFEVDHYPDYRAAMRNCVQDRFLGGRGVAWVRYEPHIKALEGTPQDGVQITEDADEVAVAEPQEQLENESAPTDYVHWKDFGHTIARTWEEVTGVWRKVYMGREALVERFGDELGSKIPLDTKPQEKRDSGADIAYEALIYEIWDKTQRKALWLSKSLGEIVDERPDPLGLENFWPCPRPLFATLTTDSLVPVPDFSLYQDQANTLDILADRIEGLIKALKVRGVYNAEFIELSRLFTEGSNNDLLPVKNWLAFAEKNGLKGAIDLVDLTPIFNALKAAYEAAEQQKNQVYEITGLSDIIRASTDPNETATAQKLKGQFGSMRLRAMQNDVSLFAGELLQIKAQIMCKQFQPETLAKIGSANTLQPEDQQLLPQALQLLKNSTLRDFRIEVASDSMVQMDEEQEKEDGLEFIKAVGGFMKDAIPAATENPTVAPVLMEMLKFGVTRFKVGKQLEGVIDSALDQLKKAAQQPQKPKQDPEMAKVQAQVQGKQAELQMEDQQHQRELAADMQREQWQMQMNSREEQMKQTFQAQQADQENRLEAARAQMQARYDAQLETLRNQVQLLITDKNNAAKIEVAEISAATTLEAAQVSAAKAAESGPT